MVLQFENPWLMLLVFPAAAFMYYTAKRMMRLAKWRRISIISLRSLVFLLVILLLAGFTLENISDTTTTLFLVDSSDSIIDKEKASSFIREAIKNMGRNDEAGVINFGGNSAIEVLPGRHPVLYGMQTRINSSYTDIENALITAQSIMPWDHMKRVVLLTDGRENAGDSLFQVKQMKSKGFSVDVYPIVAEIDQEVQLQELRIPESVNLNEQFEISINIKSNVNTKAVLQLYNDRLLAVRKEVVLNKGENQFAFTDKAANGGMVTYRVEVLAQEDTLSQNNELSSYTYVTDMPEIMLVQGSEDAGSILEDILAEDMRITVANPAQVPSELSELLRYDAFILVNVSAESLSEKFLNNLKTAVSHQGKGLLVTGGDNSYGPGGYYKTVLEEVLPVNMDIKPREEEPNLALILVIDKSGSMSGGDYGISKMELAREAAIRSTEVLNEDDMIGVIAFDDAYKWVVEPQNTTDIKAIQDAIGSIRSGGGTQILPALETAYKSILELDAGLKHIILLTDGQAERTGYEPLIEGLSENGITLSTVAVGRSADLLLMKALAYGGGGRYYETDEFTDIPRIFAKEVFLAGKKYLTNRTFMPELSGYSDILKGIDEVPQLDGYVTTTPKNTANIILVSDEKDPVLASWQYGLGRTVAWMPDVQGIWTYDWMSWNGSAKFWRNTVAWIVQQNLSKGYSVEANITGRDGTITIRADDNAFMTANEVKGTIIDPEGKKQEITLLPGAPGEYAGTFSNLKSGVYIADITLKGSDGRNERISTGLIMPYSQEYDLLENDNSDMIRKIALESEGRILNDLSQVFAGDLPQVAGSNDPFLILIIAVFLLFMLDIAIRRLNLRPDMWCKKLKPVFASGKAYIGQLSDRIPVRRTADGKDDHKAPEEKNAAGSHKSDINNHKPDKDSHISQLLEKKRKWNR